MNESVRVYGPTSLIAALPFLLGFKPSNSLLCVLLDNESITGCIRYDLTENPVEMFDLIKTTLTNHNYQTMVVVIVAEPVTTDLAALVERFRDNDIQLLDFLITDWKFYRSALCKDQTCCPIIGTALTQAQQDQMAAQLVAAGHVAVDSRSEFLAQLTSNPISLDQEHSVPLLPPLTSAELITKLTQLRRSPVSVTELIQINQALIQPEIRNDLEYHIFDSTQGELNDVSQLRVVAENIRQIAVRVPTANSSMAYGLLAFCYWNLGEWILAEAAAEISLKLDSNNSPAKLTKRLLMQAVDPVIARKQIFPSAA